MGSHRIRCAMGTILLSALPSLMMTGVHGLALPHSPALLLKVLHDMLGITQDFSPRFLRRYSNLGDQMLDAIENYVSDVRSRDFPSKDEQY